MSPHRLLLGSLIFTAALGCGVAVPGVAAPSLPSPVFSPAITGLRPAGGMAKTVVLVPVERAIYLFTGHPAIRTWASSRRRT